MDVGKLIKITQCRGGVVGNFEPKKVQKLMARIIFVLGRIGKLFVFFQATRTIFLNMIYIVFMHTGSILCIENIIIMAGSMYFQSDLDFL